MQQYMQKLFKEKGISVKQDWLEQCIEHIENELGDTYATKTKDEIGSIAFDLFLDSDLNEIGAGCIQEMVSKMHNKKLEGPLVLQIDDIKDISMSIAQQVMAQDSDDDENQLLPPSQKSDKPKGRSSSFRTLKLMLSDGMQKFPAVEYKFCPSLSADTKPGTKIAVRGVLVRRGMLLLIPQCITVLGGEVEELVEAKQKWRKQMRNKLSGKLEEDKN